MFHDAALSLFPILTYFWKKFCLQRYCPGKINIVDTEKLILKERLTKGEMYKSKIAKNGRDVETPNLQAQKLTHIPHVPLGIVHLLNRQVKILF